MTKPLDNVAVTPSQPLGVATEKGGTTTTEKAPAPTATARRFTLH